MRSRSRCATVRLSSELGGWVTLLADNSNRSLVTIILTGSRRNVRDRVGEPNACADQDRDESPANDIRQIPIIPFVLALVTFAIRFASA
jgi:hypothetical protein